MHLTHMLQSAHASRTCPITCTFAQAIPGSCCHPDPRAKRRGRIPMSSSRPYRRTFSTDPSHSCRPHAGIQANIRSVSRKIRAIRGQLSNRWPRCKSVVSRLSQIRIGIKIYRYFTSSFASSGRICPALCASLNSSRTSPVFPIAFRKSIKYWLLNPTTSGS